MLETSIRCKTLSWVMLMREVYFIERYVCYFKRTLLLFYAKVSQNLTNKQSCLTTHEIIWRLLCKNLESKFDKNKTFFLNHLKCCC